MSTRTRRPADRPTVLTVVGARPQFVKIAPLSRAIRRQMKEILVHTGQHYDPEMSQSFFDELGLPTPDHHLGVGSGPHGQMTGRMIESLERILLRARPDAVVVVGDTNSTLAGCLAANKLQIPVAHVEAGLRSFDDRMPEEINRRVTDHLSDLLFCPTPTAVRNLRCEGITRGVHRVGDVMMDAVLQNLARARRRPSRGARPREGYYLATLHRQENVDDPTRMQSILAALEGLQRPVLLPLHPRTRARLRVLGRRLRPPVTPLMPLGYLETLRLASHARAVVTDSGGLQKEAFILRTPCVTLRDSTEWLETLDAGANRLAGADAVRIKDAVAAAETARVHWSAASVYGHGRAAEAVADRLMHFLARGRGR